ncbi:hypothetical protein EON65_21940 [archaeon]|nr:MAG: hypothetical protein EON65_21940 [archaeon]
MLEAFGGWNKQNGGPVATPTVGPEIIEFCQTRCFCRIFQSQEFFMEFAQIIQRNSIKLGIFLRIRTDQIFQSLLLKL